MKSSSSVGIGLSVVFCGLLLALVAETYYLLWWKRRLIGREFEDDYSNPSRETLYVLCWKSKRGTSSGPLRSSTHHHQSTNPHVIRITTDIHANNNCIESGLVMGPPRLLFTIKEETREDLESEDGRLSRRLSDLMRNEETPYMTPAASPALFTPPLTPSIGSSHSRSSSNGNYNPFHESSTDFEFSKMRSSPPPKLKFLRDAEEKLRTKNAAEFSMPTVVSNNSKDTRKPNCHQYQYNSSSSSSQVLPLAIF